MLIPKVIVTVPVLRTAYFGGPWACLTSWTGPRLQHSLHALPNKLLGKFNTLHSKHEGIFLYGLLHWPNIVQSCVISMYRYGPSGVMCHLQMRPAQTSSFLTLFCFYLYVHVFVKRGLFSSAKEFWNGGRLLTPFPSCREVRRRASFCDTTDSVCCDQPGSRRCCAIVLCTASKTGLGWCDTTVTVKGPGRSIKCCVICVST